MLRAQVLIDSDGAVNPQGGPVQVPWWSFTKTALAIALMRLSENGNIDLHGPVPGKPYSVAQLLRHEAGLPDYGSLRRYHIDVEAGRPPWQVDELLSAVQADRLRYQPGEGWAYSNIGYREISLIIEKFSRKALADALHELVFKPAGLDTARLARVPSDLIDVHMGDVTAYHPGWVYHGLIVGSVEDAAFLLRRLLKGDLVAPNFLSEMLEGRPLPQFASRLHPDPAYGLGLMLFAMNTLDHPIGHSGSGPGSRIAVYHQHGRTGAVWAAVSSGLDPEEEVFRSLSGE